MKPDLMRLRIAALRYIGLSARAIAYRLRITVPEVHEGSGCGSGENCRGPRCNIGGSR